MEIFNNIFFKIFSALIGLAFLIYWLQYFPIFSTLRTFITSLFIKQNNKTVEDLIEQKEKDLISEELSIIESHRINAEDQIKEK